MLGKKKTIRRCKTWQVLHLEDWAMGVFSIGLVAGMFAMAKVDQGGEGDSYGAIAGILFMPSAIAAGKFTDQLHEAPRLTSAIQMSVPRPIGGSLDIGANQRPMETIRSLSSR